MKTFYSKLAAGAVLLGTLSMGIPVVTFAATGPTTDPATAITTSDATLNGTNGDTDATQSAFWVSTSTYSVAADPNPAFPAGMYSTGDRGPVASSTAFSAQLSSITYPAPLTVTPGTTYYFNAWTYDGTTWTPGAVLNFTTTASSTPPPPSHATVFVANTGSDSNDGASSSTPFATIAHAVSVVDAGGTVNVAAGTYAEHVIITKALTLSGANTGTAATSTRAAESILDGSDTDAPIAIKANDVTVNGFTVENGSNGAYFSGIWVETGHQNITVEDNIITGNGFGVWAESAGNFLISGNLFNGNNKPGAGSASVSADATTGLTITNNEFENDTAGNPILLQATAAGAHTNVTISNNTFHNNTNSNIYAIGITGGTISGNTITPAADATGISLSGADTNVTISGNTISGGARGVRVEDGGYGFGNNTNITINGNFLSSDSEYGVGNLGGYTVTSTNASTTLDATNNWWGSDTGPATATSTASTTNPGGTGSPVVGDVSYSPFCVNDTCTTPATTTPPSSGGGGGGGGGGHHNNSTSTSSGTGGTTTTTTTTTGGGQVLGVSTFNFSSDLTIGSTGDAVFALQEILIADGYLQIAGPTGYFGPLTQAAVKLYQAAHGIITTGYVGPLTRAALNAGNLTDARAAAIAAIRNALPGILAAILHIQAELQAMINAGTIH
jgi:parallel beta-helix repeat protein